MNKLYKMNRLPVREFNNKVEKKPVKDVAKEYRDKAEKLGFDFKTTSRRLSKANLEAWREYVIERNIAEKAEPKMFNDTALVVKRADRFGVTERQYAVQVVDLINKDNIKSIDRYVSREINRIIREVTQGMAPDDKIWLGIKSTREGSDVSAFTKQALVGDTTSKMLLDEIRRALQSSKSFGPGDVLYVKTYQKPRGGNARKVPSTYDAARALKSVIAVDGSLMNDCFFQCIALDKAYFLKENGDDKMHDRLNRNPGMKEKYRIQAAKKLYTEAERCYCDDVAGNESNMVSIDEVPKLEVALGISISIYDWGSRSFIYKSASNKNYYVYLMYYKGHFDLIRSMKTLLGSDNFCVKCHVGYNKNHGCSEMKKCPACYKEGCEGSVCACESKSTECSCIFNYKNRELTACPTCNFKFFGKTCLENHQKGSKCDTSHKCTKCKAIYDPRKIEHKCDHSMCANCKQYVVMDEHKCYHQKKPLKKPSDKIMALDIETDPNAKHEFLMGVLSYPYTSVEDMSKKYDKPEHFKVVDGCLVFEELEHFARYIFDKRHKGFKAYAHFGGRYDHHFLRNYMAGNGVRTKNQVANGCKFLSISTFAENGVELLDSYNLIPVALARFPKTFNLEGMKKGYFPYTFATKANCKEVYECYPNVKHYAPNEKKTKVEQKEFYAWYEGVKNTWFDVWQEMSDYCISDVKILSGGIRAFRDEMLSLTDGAFDPTEYITMASAAQAIYRALFMPENTIAVINSDLKLNQERKETKWLYYIESTQGIKLERQKKIGSYFSSGYEQDTKTVYDFLGCFWHGCSKCYNADSVNKVSGKRMSELHFLAKKRAEYIGKYNKYEAVYECEFDNDPKVKAFFRKAKSENDPVFEEMEIAAQATLKEAFTGGNTQAFKTYASVDGKIKRIKYFDFTSLYPSVNYSRYRPVHKEAYHMPYVTRYPIGHPVRMPVHEVNADLSNVIGVVKCKVIPSKLYSPILPQKKDGKLMFHTRPFVGCFFSEELKFAIQHGYKVEEIYDVINFPLTFEKPEVAENLFSGYVKMFIKIKLEADGKPENQDLDQYIKEVALNDGIILDPENMTKKNEGRRFIAKQFLNSLWGKFGMNLDRDEIATFSDPDLFHKFINDERYILKNLVIVNRQTIDVTYSTKAPFIKPAYNTNTAIALATTGYARMRLQEAMQIIGTDLVYCDTDSIIFIDDTENPHPIVTSSLLGDLKDELEGDYIINFISTGPKSYSYVTAGGKTCTKIKGFTLNLEAQEELNHTVLKRFIRNKGDAAAVELESRKFVIDKHDRTITTKHDATKTFKMEFNKREVDWTFDRREGCVVVDTRAY